MNETAEQNESPDAADSSSSSNFLDKAKNFITLGGDKKKWTRVLIISAIVIAIMGIASLMIWGIALWALARATAEPNGNFGGSGYCQDAFNPSQHPLYEQQTSYPDLSSNSCNWCNQGCGAYETKRKQIDWVRSDAGKQYAINTLGISESSIVSPDAATVENMIRAEVVSQFNQLSNKNNSTVAEAQRAILTYARAEHDDLSFLDSQGKPKYTCDSSGDCTQLFSLTDDKFDNNHLNKRVAASYDIKYNIYLGVKESMAMFNTSCPQGDGINRWHDAIACVWLNNTSSFWQGNSGSRANPWWSKFASEVAYVCDTVFGTVDISNLASWYYNQGGTNHTGGGYWGPKPGQCSGWSVNNYASRGCAITSAAMIARYYGKNIDPYQMGAEMCRKTGSIALDVGVVAKFIGKSYDGKNHPSVNDIQSVLNRGPVLAQGSKAFNSSGQHWVVIVSISNDKLIINDPTTRGVGGPGKQWPISEISKLQNIYWFTK